MKTFSIILTFVSLTSAMPASPATYPASQSPSTASGTHDPSVIQFVHPGTLINPSNILSFSNLASADASISKSKKDILDFAAKDLSKSCQARAEVQVVFNPAPHDKTTTKAITNRVENKKLIDEGAVAGHEQFTGDSVRCYKHTIAYLLTKDARYAEKCMQLISTWASTCTKFGFRDQNGPLEAGWGLASFARSAELLKYTYPGWKTSNVEQAFIAFVDTILMPNLKFFDKNGLIGGFAAHGNWGSTIVEARLQYAIFKEDKVEYNFCLRSFHMLFDNILKESGQAGETKRDIVHAQFGLAGLSGISEILKHQGLDVYASKNNLLHKAYEYHAAIILGDVPSDLDKSKLNWVKFIPSNWEAAYAHFSIEKGMDMPNTARLLSRNRPEKYEFHWGMGTLTHYAFAGQGNGTTQRPVYQPPVIQPPVIQSPVYQSPVIQPPVIQPPVYKPPVIQPPIIQPPVRQPPVEQIPVVQSPAYNTPQSRPKCRVRPSSAYGIPKVPVDQGSVTSASSKQEKTTAIEYKLPNPRANTAHSVAPRQKCRLRT